MTVAPDPEITPPHSSDAYRRRRGLSIWWVLALCAVSLGAGLLLATFGPHWWPVREKERPFAALTAEPQPTAPTATAEPPVIVPEAVNEAAPTPDLMGVEMRLDALEAGQDKTMDAATAALAAALLAEAASTSRPFEKELTALEQVLPLSPDALALRRLAQTGAPTRSALAAEFDDAAAEAAVAARDPGEQGAFLDRLTHALSSIVIIRRVGLTVGDSPDAVLARAERQVEEGDIDGALTTLNKLPVRARQAMTPWRAAAERRAEIDRHVTALRATALANLAQAAQS